MSLQCPRCTSIASLLASAAYRPRHLPRLYNHHPTIITPTTTSYRAISTSLSRDRSATAKRVWQAHKDAVEAEKGQNGQNGALLRDKLWAKESLDSEQIRELQGYLLTRHRRGQEDVSLDLAMLVDAKGQGQGGHQKPDRLIPTSGKTKGGSSSSSIVRRDKPARKEREITHPDQTSRGVRQRLEEQWSQREADHQASFVKGANVEITMEKLVENVDWKAAAADEVGSAPVYDSGTDEGMHLDPESFATRLSDLEPGTLVEVRYTDASIPFLTVLLKNKTGNFSRDSFALTSQGALIMAKLDMTRFALREFIPPEKVQQLIDYVEEHGRLDNGIVQEITVEIRKFRAACQTLFSDYSNEVSKLHPKLTDPSMTRTFTTMDIARLVTGTERPKAHELYATHLALLTNRNLYSVEEDNSDVTCWAVKPFGTVTRTKRVEALIRQAIDDRDSEAGKILMAFIEKARRVIDYSRKARAEGEMKEPLDVVWDPTDLDILTTLDEALDYRRADSTTLKSLYPFVLRILDRYEKNRLLNEQRLFEFLGEVGACSPWEDSVVRERQLGLPGHHTNPQADEWAKLYEQVEQPGGVESLGLVDKMASIRHDWGDLPVYCVDDASTKEIDDGVSIEKVEGTDDVWLRIHVANPTAFLPMDHWISQIARSRVSTSYTPQRNYPMLPLSLSVDKLGLAPNRPAMTFSMRVDMGTMEIIDQDVRVSTVRDVRRITYDQLDGIFLKEKAPTPIVLSNKPLEAKNEQPEVEAKLSDKDLENMKLLHSLAWGLRLNRMETGALESSFQSQLKVKVDNGHGNLIHPGIKEKPVFDIYEPRITLTVWNRIKSGETFWWQDVIREFMTLAGNIVAKWSAERGMSQLYRAHDFVWNSESEKENWYSMLERATNEEGYTSEDFWRLFFPVGMTEMSTTMKPHTAMGMEGYIKATSPLRRFGDFVTHHIIERRLLAEAGDESMMTPMFSDEELGTLAKEIFEKERQYSSAEKASERLWTIRLLKQLWEQKDKQLEEILPVTIVATESSPAAPMSGQIKTLGLSGVRVHFPSNIHGKVKYGDVVKAKLSDWHWSTDSNNTQMLSMDFVDYVETLEDRKAKFYKDIGEGTSWRTARDKIKKKRKKKKKKPQQKESLEN